MIIKEPYSIHNHTVLCHHASGSMEEYVNAARANGVKIFGFSDHIPFQGVVEPNIRMSVEDIPVYEAEFLRLREKYRDMKMFLGFEAEYVPEKRKEYLAYLQKGYYFILGQHGNTVSETGLEGRVRTLTEPGDIMEYTQIVAEAMKTGMFLYVAHPDIAGVNRLAWNEEFTEAADLLCRTASECNCPLEINLGGERTIEKGRRDAALWYPRKEFWKRVEKWQAPTVIGVDSHEVGEIEQLEYQMPWLEELKLNQIIIDEAFMEQYFCRIQKILGETE